MRAMDAPAASDSARRHKAAAKRCSMACTTCRQVKLKCDAATKYPAPCSRCEKKHKTCLFDPGFKRLPVRGALEKVLEEKEQLARMVASLQETSRTMSPASGAVTSEDESPGWPAAEGYELGGVHVDAQTAQELYQYFLDFFFQHLPILDIHKPLDVLKADSPLLFWTVLVTATQHHPIHRVLLDQLLGPLRRLLGDKLVKPFRWVCDIQALLVLSTWPPSVTMQSDDPAWHYCSVAVGAALALRLHEPEGSYYYSETGARQSAGDAETRSRTWLGCFLVSSMLATDMGLPPMMHALAAVEPTVRLRVTLPPDFVARLELQSWAFRTHVLLRDTINGPALLQPPLLDLLERDIEAIEARLTQAQGSPLTVRLDLLAAKLRLLAPMLLRKPADNRDADETSLQAAWHKGAHVAAELIRLFSGYLHETGPAGLPKHYHRTYASAAVFLLLFLATHHRDPASGPATAVARRRIEAALDGCASVVRTPLDEHDRLAKVLRLLRRHAEDDAAATDFREARAPSPSATIIDNGIEVLWRLRKRYACRFIGLALPSEGVAEVAGPGPVVAEGVAEVGVGVAAGGTLATLPGAELAWDDTLFTDTLFTDWGTWFDETDDLMDLFQMSAE